MNREQWQKKQVKYAALAEGNPTAPDSAQGAGGQTGPVADARSVSPRSDGSPETATLEHLGMTTGHEGKNIDR